MKKKIEYLLVRGEKEVGGGRKREDKEMEMEENEKVGTDKNREVTSQTVMGNRGGVGGRKVEGSNGKKRRMDKYGKTVETR